MNVRGEQGLVGIDISESGDDALVEEGALDAPAAAVKESGERFASGLERLGAEAGEYFRRVQLPGAQTSQEPEFPDIAEAELRPVVAEGQAEVGVLVEGLSGRPDKELAGHLEMKNQAEPALD